MTNSHDLYNTDLFGKHHLISRSIIPFGPSRLDTGTMRVAESRATPDSLPKLLEDYPLTQTRVYDLSVTAAANANLPVFDMSGGASRRVVVWERVKYLEHLNEDSSVDEYGFAIRLVLTVNRVDSSTNLRIPVIAASAQLSQVEARWQMQLMGLVGATIEGAILPPRDLDVETFVIAQQSLEKIIGSINAPDTKFVPVLVARRPPRNDLEVRSRTAVGRMIGLDAIKDGNTETELLRRIAKHDSTVQDNAIDVYRQLAGNLAPNQSPSPQARQIANTLLNGVDVR